jgi:hypothetical protein
VFGACSSVTSFTLPGRLDDRLKQVTWLQGYRMTKIGVREEYEKTRRKGWETLRVLNYCNTFVWGKRKAWYQVVEG